MPNLVYPFVFNSSSLLTKLCRHSKTFIYLYFFHLACFLIFMVWTSLRMLLLWFADGSLVNSALLLIVGVNVTMTFTESLLWGMFTAPVLIQSLAGIAPFRLFDPKLEGRARVVSNP